MSADLFAEFNDLSSPKPQQQQPSAAPSQPLHQAPQDPFGSLQGGWNSPPPASSQPWGGYQNQQSNPAGWGQVAPMSGFSRTKPQADDDDDGWGDFEVADSKASQPAPPKPEPWPTVGQPAQPIQPISAIRPGGPAQARLVRASTMDIMNNNLVNLDGSSKPTSAHSKTESQPVIPHEEPRRKLREPTDPSVLFDAQEFELEGGEEDEYDEDDDFGDFETVAPPPKPAPAPGRAPVSAPPRKQPEPPPSMDLLSLDDPEPAAPVQPQSRSNHKSSASVSLSFGATKITASQEAAAPAKAPKPKPASPAKKPAVAVDDDWAAWDDFEPAPAKKAEVKSPALESQAADSWDWGAADTTSTPAPKPKAQDDQPPPINVPPPSVLLSAFPSLFSTGNSLFKPVASQNTSIKQRILTDPKAMAFLHSYILIATTAARVIAGRKHRWHRDKILAKSMSISAAGSKGMKLAGVDKTQSAREDREAADVAAAWREYVGRLRSAVAAANSAGKGPPLKVPELSENMPVQTAKGALTAAKPCIICGLKRDERVSKVDFDVEDSFGEWWVDHWGHRACKNFWLEHEGALRQR